MLEEAGRWLPPPADPTLQTGEVHVWRASLLQSPDALVRLSSLLDEGELERAERFRFQRDRRRFVVAHAALRDILAYYVARPAAALRFDVNAYGKPALLGADSWLHFNLSHAGEWALVAVSGCGPVGVDVERVREDFGGEVIARRFFSAIEVDSLFSLPPERRSEAFFLCWTRKEAFIKAMGLGVSFPLDGFAVSLNPEEPARLLWVRDDLAAGENWTLAGLRPGEGYVGALATPERPRIIYRWQWQIPR